MAPPPGSSTQGERRPPHDPSHGCCQLSSADPAAGQTLHRGTTGCAALLLQSHSLSRQASGDPLWIWAFTRRSEISLQRRRSAERSRPVPPAGGFHGSLFRTSLHERSRVLALTRFVRSAISGGRADATAWARASSCATRAPSSTPSTRASSPARRPPPPPSSASMCAQDPFPQS